MDRRQALAWLTASLASPVASALTPRRPTASSVPPAVNVFTPHQFGARVDGVTLDSPSINAAIQACTQAGGGVVYCPPGRYLCGTVELKSNVTLYLEAGAVLLGSTDVSQYTPKPGPDPNSDAGQGHLIYARNADNISIVGSGRIDGQGHSFWVPTNRPPVPDAERWADRRHADWKPKARISPMVELVDCTNLRLESVELVGASGWTLRPINCTQVFIHAITISNPAIGPNTDGIDLTGCQDVSISDCHIATGDDAICLKSENPYGAGARLSKNIVVTNCILTSSTTAFKIGTATQGGFENIAFSNSIIVSSDPDLASRMIAGIAIEMVDGGWIEGVVVTGIQMQDARAPLFIRRGNRSNPFPTGKAGLRGIQIDGVHATGAILTSSITGIPTTPVEDVRLSNIHVDTVMPGQKAWLKPNVPEVPDRYPESRMFGWLPASGLYCRHVRGLSLKDVTFTAPASEWRPTVMFDDVQDLTLRGFRTTPVLGGVAPVVLDGTQDVWIADAVAPRPSSALVKVAGSNTEDLLISGCDVRHAAKVADPSPEVKGSAIREEFNILMR